MTADEAGGARHRVRVLEQLAELAGRLHRARASPARSSGVRSSNSNSHSRSWRGSPVQAQIRCLTSTWLVVSASPSLNDGQQPRRRRVPRQLALIDQLGEHQRRHRLGVRGDHEQRVGVDRRGAAELAHAEAAGEDHLAVLDQADDDAGHAGRLASALDEGEQLVDARRVERVRLPAGERLARVALRQQLPEDQPDLRAALLADGLRHVVDRDHPRVAGLEHAGAHVAPFVRRRLVGERPALRPAVLVGLIGGQLERPLRGRVVELPRFGHRGVAVRRSHVDQREPRARLRRFQDGGVAAHRHGPARGRDEGVAAHRRFGRVGRQPFRRRCLRGR